jgi:hypothetical protein
MQNSYKRLRQNNQLTVNPTLPNGPENSLVCNGNICCRVEADSTQPPAHYHVLCWNKISNRILINKDL